MAREEEVGKCHHSFLPLFCFDLRSFPLSVSILIFGVEETCCLFVFFDAC